MASSVSELVLAAGVAGGLFAVTRRGVEGGDVDGRGGGEDEGGAEERDEDGGEQPHFSDGGAIRVWGLGWEAEGSCE